MPLWRRRANQEGHSMKFIAHPLAAFALVVGAATLGAGCSRQESVPPGAAVAPNTSVGTKIDDTVVTTKVKSALVADQEIKGLQFQVETRKGVVQLSGFADNQGQIDRAVNVAKSVEGVSGVENGVTLKAGKVSVGNKVDDGIVTAKVKSALLSDPTIKALDIAVATSKGAVQLSGFVDNQAQIDQAIAVAKGIEGVAGVESKMSIKQ
jgi:hyperosmotically inducible protein